MLLVSIAIKYSAIFQNFSRDFLYQFSKFLALINWDKVFKNGPSKICGGQLLKNFTWTILEYFVPIVTQNILMYIATLPCMVIGNAYDHVMDFEAE